MQYSIVNYKTIKESPDIRIDGELPDGVAEKFIEWAKSEKISFWNKL